MDQFNRLELLIGKNTFVQCKQTTVLVLGLGGVGSYAVEALVRSGIGRIILVDPDVIDITNLNRQLMALHSNIGKPKVDVWKERIESIQPTCEVIILKEYITEHNINLLFETNPDYVIDACDTIATKKALILACLKRKIKLISCMGTGNKLDPTALKITDIRSTSYDPIAKIIRKMIREQKIKEKVMVVWSDEIPVSIDSSTIASNAFVPGCAGLLCASYVINDIVSRCKCNDTGKKSN